MFRLAKNLKVNRNGAWVHVSTIRRPENIQGEDGIIIPAHYWSKLNFEDMPALGIKRIIVQQYNQEAFMAIDKHEVETPLQVHITYTLIPREYDDGAVDREEV